MKNESGGGRELTISGGNIQNKNKKIMKLFNFKKSFIVEKVH